MYYKYQFDLNFACNMMYVPNRKKFKKKLLKKTLKKIRAWAKWKFKKKQIFVDKQK